MMNITMSLLIGVLAIVAAAFVYRRRIVHGRGTMLSDEQIVRIESDGMLDIDDEPLDLDSIREEEREFWEESWDEPEEL